MSEIQKPAVQSPEQLRYATLLDWGSRIGFVVLVLTFAAYTSGIFSLHVQPERLPEFWSLPVGSYLQLTQSPTGWGWLGLVHHGDVAGLIGIAILAGCSLVCLLALVPLYWRRGDKTFVALCLAEAAVLLLAASGWLTSGH